MRTNIDIDEALMAEAMEATGTTTKKAAVEAALTEMVRRKRQREVLKSFGTIDWQGDLNQMRLDKPDSPWLS
jgi:Arc/MetJ family transcription regulator